MVVGMVCDAPKAKRPAKEREVAKRILFSFETTLVYLS
jgi:hypothetical protein